MEWTNVLKKTVWLNTKRNGKYEGEVKIHKGNDKNTPNTTNRRSRGGTR